MEDERLVGKPKTNDGSLPVMRYDFQQMPFISLGIWHAQHVIGFDGTGWPPILTYDHKSFATMTRAQKRYQMNLDGVPTGAITPGMSRDEYPFASTVENAGSVFVSNVPIAEQDIQRHLINNFYREHDAYKGVAGKPFYFEVSFKNLPAALR